MSDSFGMITKRTLITISIEVLLPEIILRS